MFLRCSELAPLVVIATEKVMASQTLKFFASSLLSMTLAMPSIALMPMIPLRARLV